MWLAVIFGMVSSCSLLLTVDMLSKDTHTHILISSWQYLRHLEYSENKCSRWHNHSQWCESLCIFCTCSLFVQMNKVIANLFKGSPIMLKMYFLSFSTLRRFLCMLKIWKVKKVQKAPLSHREHSFWNASSVCIPCLCDITPHVTVSQICINFRRAVSLACRNWFSSAALMLLAVLGQACADWPIRRDWVFRRGELKGTGAETEHLQLQHRIAWEDRWGFWANI